MHATGNLEVISGFYRLQVWLYRDFPMSRNFWMGKKITLEVETSDDIEDVIVETLPNNVIRSVKIRIHENKAYDSESLNRSSVSGSTMHLGVYLKVSMQIFVETVIGERFTFEVESSDTIASLMEKIKDQERFPIKHQRLVFEGKLMEKNLTLAHYNVQNQSTIQLLLQIGAQAAPSNTNSTSSKRKRSEEI